MNLSTVLEYNKPETMERNSVLLEIARKVVNSSPEPRYKIKLRDEVLAMKEKERLGFSFNRSVTASLKARWDVVEKATVDYLGEIINMNEQIEEDQRKYENQLINLIVTGATNLNLDSRIEQMAGLLTHMNFYCAVLRFKIQHLEPHKQFIFECSDSLGFSRPSQLMNRYAALQHVFTELYADYETRQTQLNKITEALSDIKAETSHRNMLMHNQMATLHERLKHKQTENAEIERNLHEQMAMSSITSLEIYKIKNAVNNLYSAMMAYRGMDAHESNIFRQLDELEVRLTNTLAVVKERLEEDARLQMKKSTKKKRQRRDSVATSQEEEEDDDSDGSNISIIESKTKPTHLHEHNVGLNVSKKKSGDKHENKNVSAIESASFDCQALRPTDVKNQKLTSVRFRATRCENFDANRNQSRAESMSLPPINVRGSLITAVTQEETKQQKEADWLRLLDNNSNILIWRDAFKARGNVRSECASNNTNSNTVSLSDSLKARDKFKSVDCSETIVKMVIPRVNLRKRENFRSEGGSYSTAKYQPRNLVKRLLKRSATVEISDQSFRNDENMSSHEGLPGFPKPQSGSWTEANRRYSNRKTGHGLVSMKEIPRRGSSDELCQAKPSSGSSREQEKQVCTSSKNESHESGNFGDSKVVEDVMQKKTNLQAREGDSAILPRRSSAPKAVNVPGTKLRESYTEKTHAGKTRAVNERIEKRKFRENCLEILSKVKLRSSPPK